MESGFLMMSWMAADAAAVRVVTRNTWTIWNAKYAFWT